jgi:lysine 6-dehydrogenase
MRVLVIGAGWMGRAAAYDLAHRSQAAEVGLAEREPSTLQSAIDWIGLPKVKGYRLDAADLPAAEKLMARFDAALSAVPYSLNAGLARAAVAARCHFCDLGGNNDVVEEELALDAQAREAGVTIIPDCGLAPGMVTILAAHGVRQFDRAEAVQMRVGGLPLHPKPPLNYKLVFSPYGLINEYVEPAVVLEHGEIRTVPSLTGIEQLEFPLPFGKLEAFYTSGGTSTLPKTLAGKVRDLDYKTIRYPGHCERFKVLIDLGLADQQPRRVGEVEVSPRDVLATLLRERLVDDDDEDVVLVRVTVTGERGGQRQRLTYELIAHAEPSRGLTAMMRTTAFPAAVIAGMLADGTIAERGALPQEVSVPAEKFFQRLEQRSIAFDERWESA